MPPSPYFNKNENCLSNVVLFRQLLNQLSSEMSNGQAFSVMPRVVQLLQSNCCTWFMEPWSHWWSWTQIQSINSDDIRCDIKSDPHTNSNQGLWKTMSEHKLNAAMHKCRLPWQRCTGSKSLYSGSTRGDKNTCNIQNKRSTENHSGLKHTGNITHTYIEIKHNQPAPQRTLGN